MATLTGASLDIEMLKDSMTRYNRAILRDDMAEAMAAQRDCTDMMKIIESHSPTHAPKARLIEHRRPTDNTTVNLYDHVFINGLRYKIEI